jgi:SNF2 family DNA or RNA helicase
MFFGAPKERQAVLNDFKMGRLDVGPSHSNTRLLTLLNPSIVLTSFDLARREIDLLDDLPWSCVFVDEVHRVKNSRSKITEAYHQFSCQRRFGLTGTAIQNSYLELWTILDWTNPGRLGSSKQWTGFVARPLTIGQSAGATEDQRATALVMPSHLERLLELTLGPRPWLRF